LPWNFITPLTLLIIGFLISLAFCIVRIVIRNGYLDICVLLIYSQIYSQIPGLRVNFPVVGFAAHAVAAICYFAAAVILIYALTADEDNPLFVAKDRNCVNTTTTYMIDNTYIIDI